MKKVRIWISLLAAASCLAACSDSDDSNNTDKCADVSCKDGLVCSPDTGKCEAARIPCSDGKCPSADYICNTQTNYCEPKPEDKCPGKSCPEGQTCNPSNGECEGEQTVKCTVSSCAANEVCNLETGRCDPKPIEDKCADIKCYNGQTCDPDTGRCVTPSTPAEDDECSDTKPCRNPDYEACVSGKCVNKSCIDTQCNAWEFCSLTGKCVPETNRCNVDDDCDGSMTCNTSSHSCEYACEMEPDENIVPNWSFEDWNVQGNTPENWILENTQNFDAIMSKSSDANACDTSVSLINTTKVNARLVSESLHIPENDFIGKEKYACSVWIKGTGSINVGYRTPKEGKTDKYDYFYKTQTTLLDTPWKEFGFEMSVSSGSEAQLAIAFQATESAGLKVDSFTCVRKPNLCDDKICKDYQICTTANYGKCIPREGFCETDTNCTAVQSCNTETHLCEAQEGKCASHLDCADGTLKFCDTKTNTCIEGDPCKDVVCDEWKACNARSGRCELKEGRCIKSSDCTGKDKPACYNTTHTCVDIDTTFKVSKASECPRTGYDSETKECPVNIVPNGGFEQWEEEEITDTYSVSLPVAWYGMDFDIAATHYATELAVENVHDYTKAPRSGGHALQIEFSSDKPADRFTSMGFNVPGGAFDCSYWVRGKGDVRLHSYSSRGDAPKTNFVSYDTDTWVRVPFTIKEAASAMRLIFYVSHTDPAKDHIQIDDVVCTSYSY